MIVAHEFNSFSDQLLSYLYRLTANKQDAEDILHDTFLKASEKIDTFKGNSSLKTWVFSIATNLAKDNQRVIKRWSVDAQDQCKNAAIAHAPLAERMVSTFHQQTEEQFEITEHINYCFTCLAKNLQLEQQIAIILMEMYEFKRAEIAAILNLSEGVVKHLLFEGRKELQQKYEQRCALINKKGVCYQCAELNDYFEQSNTATEKISKLGFVEQNSAEKNLDLRFQLIQKINPLTSKGAALEDVIMQILREAIGEK
jgi:RNA polymerase sigma-70 factor (ECF subfamily)